ncbi:hypothetical protein [Streptomyces sp. NRRL S-1896]|uniref:hypothetical protein n=1 Tax=Streptomyces sp. NRRL S-1896 TaxID=1463893 RepID=UPI0004C6C8C9|nr:hypothetical protein [Streptomyces sp. NRRL S-1896]
MSPLERLLAEAIPTRPPAKPAHEPWTPAEQARHWDDLGLALNGWTYKPHTPASRPNRAADTQHPTPTINARQTAA